MGHFFCPAALGCIAAAGIGSIAASLPLTVFATAPKSKTIALVMANGAYTDSGIGKLEGPANDASLIAAALRGVGYQDVTIEQDLSRSAMIQVLSRFSKRAKGAPHAVVYFSGHSTRSEGRAWLVPVDWTLSSRAGPPDETDTAGLLPLADLAAAVRGARNGWVLLDGEGGRETSPPRVTVAVAGCNDGGNSMRPAREKAIVRRAGV